MNIRNILACIVLLGALGTGGCTGLTTKQTSSNPSSASTNATGSTSSPVAAQLFATPANLNFGSVTLGNATAQLLSLTNTGGANVTIASVSTSATGFGTSAGSNITLTPNQSVTISVAFQPTVAGSATGILSIASTATNSVLQVGLSGTGTAIQPDQHSVTLDWSPSSSTVAGYYIYRGMAVGGPYAKVTPLMDPDPSFLDVGVASGGTYYYVVTSVDASNVESGFSNQVTVSVP